jgi:hypothetical protein
MATHEIPILGSMTAPDATGKVFFEPLETAMSLGTATLGTLLGITMQAPAGAGDDGLYGNFTVPQNYVGTPVLVIRGYIGEAANSLGFGISYQPALADSESLEQAFDTEDVVTNATWTGYAAEDLYEETISLTPAAAFVAGDIVNFFFFRDDSGDNQTGEFHLASLALRYSDA